MTASANTPERSAPSAAYVSDVFCPRRRLTRVVSVGDVAVGGDQPIRLQSMTTTDTLDTAGTADQTERCIHETGERQTSRADEAASPEGENRPEVAGVDREFQNRSDP